MNSIKDMTREDRETLVEIITDIKKKEEREMKKGTSQEAAPPPGKMGKQNYNALKGKFSSKNKGVPKIPK